MRNHRDIKLATSDKRRKKFSEHLMAMEMKKIRVKMTKPLFVGMSILDVRKILMFGFWYDYINPIYGGRAKLCYTDTDSFIITLKPKIFSKIFLMMLRDGLMHLIIKKMIKYLFQ